MQPLPVDELCPRIVEQLLDQRAVILRAPPGSGKTTRVAPALINAGLSCKKNRAYLLQPRRVAAVSTAHRTAFEQGWQVGREVGYQVRFDSQVSDETALVVATEGVLLRRLADDPTAEGIGCIILDEFHERSLNADLLLAMTRNIQQLVRDDLRLVVMSATLDTETLQQYMASSVLETTGTLHPVDIRYRPPRSAVSLWEHVAETVLLTLERTDGDILVFLPGVGEISRVEGLLKPKTQGLGCRLLPLHGSLPLDRQQEVFRQDDRRRVILSTNVAETSLTIEGIRTVIDSGKVRVLRFDPKVGLNRLQLESVSQNSATQRSGRAGRVESGTCMRLWDEASQRARRQQEEPEIRRIDISSAILQLYQWAEKPEDFPWFESPRAESILAAKSLLSQLGAIEDERITDLGRQMSQLAVSPRLARMLLESGGSPYRREICLLAALLSERDPFARPRGEDRAPRGPGRHPSGAADGRCDMTQRLLALREYFEHGKESTGLGNIHRGAAQALRRVAEQLERQLNRQVATTDSPQQVKPAADDARPTLEETVARCLLAAFPDRLAVRRKPGKPRGLMVGGRGVRLAPESGVRDAELFLCVDVDDRQGEALVRKASGVDADWLDENQIEQREELYFNPTRKQVEARMRRYWGDLLLSESTVAVSDLQACAKLLFAEASKDFNAIMPNDESSCRAFLIRLRCLRDWSPELNLPDVETDLLPAVLLDLCHDRRSFPELRAAPWLDWIKSRLTPEQQRAIELEAPEKIEVPSGNRLKITYAQGQAPVLAVRIQEIFSWTATPRIAFGKVPLLLHLLAPNFRPQQVTDDLESFWSNTYDVVRKELRRRYPKHAWPEDPLTAKPESKGGRRR